MRRRLAKRILMMGASLLAAGGLAAVAAVPAQAAAGNFRAVSAGGSFACAIKSLDGSLNCWGYDNLTQTEAPAGSFRSVSAGLNHSCAIRSGDGSLACWGYDPNGQASPPAGSFGAVSAGAYHSCAINADNGSIVCWGDNTYGELNAPPGSYNALSAGIQANCAIGSADGSLACWGTNDHGELDAPSGSFSAIDAHGYTFCAISSADGSVDCWGDNSYGQTTNEPAGSFSDVGVGQSHVCAVQSADGAVVCWGLDGSGQSSPPAFAYTEVDGGENNTCALRSVDGRVDCWGDDFRGQSHPPAVADGATSSIERDTDRIAADGVSTATITVEGKDQYGDARSVGGDLVAMQTTLGSLSAVTDNGDGTYSATLTSTPAAGTAFISAQINDVDVTIPVVNAQNFVHFVLGPRTTIAPASFDFGSVSLGGWSPLQKFTVKNTGDADLEIYNVGIGAPDSSDFVLASGYDGCTGQTLAPGAYCSVKVRFRPAGTTPGARQAQLVVDNSDVSGQDTIFLNGTATGYPTLRVTPDPADLGSVPVGSLSSQQKLIVRNISASPVAIGTAVLAGTDPGQFQITADTCAGTTLPAGATCALRVRFRPAGPGSKSAELDLRDGATTIGATTLTGIATAIPDLRLAPAAHDFGSVAIDQTSPSQKWTVKNTGGTTIHVTSADLQGADAAQFQRTASTCTDVDLAPGLSCTVKVRFRPTGTSGPRAAQLAVVSDVPGTHTADLTGIAVSDEPV
jgi:hypothetical protein